MRAFVTRAVRHPAQRRERTQIVGTRLQHRRGDRTCFAQPPRELERLRAIQLPRRARRRIVGKRRTHLEHLGAGEQRIHRAERIAGVHVRHGSRLGHDEQCAHVVRCRDPRRRDALIRGIEIADGSGQRG